MNTNSKKTEPADSPRIPEPVADSVESNLDPKVKMALSQMAGKVRARARERAKALEKDISMLIGDFVRGYGIIDPAEYPGHRQPIEGLPRGWQNNVEDLCHALGKHVGEIDVERYVQNLSAKILEIDPTH
jgi:hypothetical protein